MKSVYETNQASYNKNIDQRFGKSLPAWKLQVRKKLLDKAYPGASLLDLGAGTGRDSLAFKEEGLAVTALDLSNEMVRYMTGQGLRALQCNFIDLDQLNEKFDLIWSMNALLHVPKSDMAKVLGGIRSLMKDEAVAVIGFYGGEDSEGIFEDDHYQPKRFFSFYKDQDILSLMTKYFTIIDFTPIPLEDDPHHHFQSFTLKK